MKSNSKKTDTPFKQFTRAMDALVTVPRSELTRLLDEEKQEKAEKKRAKQRPASSDHASSDGA